MHIDDISNWKAVGDLDKDLGPSVLRFDPVVSEVGGAVCEDYRLDEGLTIPFAPSVDPTLSLQAVGLITVLWAHRAALDGYKALPFWCASDPDSIIRDIYDEDPVRFRRLILSLYCHGYVRPDSRGEWELTPIGRRPGYSWSYPLEGDDEGLSYLDHALRMARRDPARFRSGSVYLMHDSAYGYYKIGLSDNPARRLAQINKIHPRTQLLHTIETDQMERLEYGWHMAFAEWRVDGEWFDLPAERVAEFKRYRAVLFNEDLQRRRAPMGLPYDVKERFASTPWGESAYSLGYEEGDTYR